MAYRNLAEFLEELAGGGELLRVQAEVDPREEAAAIVARVAAGSNAAVLFGRLRGREGAVVANLLGSERRVCRAFGVPDLKSAADRIAGHLRSDEPEGWFERLNPAGHKGTLKKLSPRPVKSAACQQVVRLGGDVDLGGFPFLHAWPQEPCPTIPAATVVTVEPESENRFVGRCDVAILDSRRAAIGWQPHEPPLAWLRRSRQPLPVAIVLGGDPAIGLAAAAPLVAVDAFALAGVVREKPIDVVPCRSIALAVPAEAEIVIEGTIDPASPMEEVGPLAVPSGGVVGPRPMPAMRIAAVTHRANAVATATLYAAGHESTIVTRWMTLAMLPVLRLALPGLVDLELPLSAAARHAAVAALDVQYPGQPRLLAAALWTMPATMFAKTLVLVDAGVDVASPAAVEAAVARTVDPAVDVFWSEGPIDVLDAASAGGGFARRMAIDATEKRFGRGRNDGGRRAGASATVEKLLADRWPSYRIEP